MIKRYNPCCCMEDWEADGEYVKYTDHLADKESAVLAERKATKYKIVEILKTVILGDERMTRYTAETIRSAISKIEEEVK